MEIGKEIQRLRRAKNLTQEQMAAALGVTSAAVSKWETNAAVPDVAMLCPLARLLGTTVDALLDFRPALKLEEVNALLEERRRLFEEGRIEEAIASCEGLLREYPDDLQLKCAAAGLYVMYVPAICDAGGMKDPVGRAVQLLEQSRESRDAALAACARGMLVNLYAMREEYDKALRVLDEEPERRQSVGTARANILLRKGELDDAEKLYQTELWAVTQNAVLNLVGLYHAASRREDWERAMGYVDAALEMERTLHAEELGGLTASLHMLRAEALLRQGCQDAAMVDLTEYVDRSLDQWTRLKNAEEIHSEFYDKLRLRGSGMSAAYLAKRVRAALEESGELASLRGREGFQILLARLEEIAAQ